MLHFHWLKTVPHAGPPGKLTQQVPGGRLLLHSGKMMVCPLQATCSLLLLSPLRSRHGTASRRR